MTKLHVIALAIFLAAAPLLADIVHLKNGGRIQGKVLEQTADAVKIRTPAGEVSIPRASIDRVERKSLPADEYKKTLKTLEKDDVLGHYALGMWCKENRLRDEAREQFLYVIKLSANHAGARRQLGQERFRGRWMTREEVKIAKGLVKHGGKWMTPGEAKKLELIDKQGVIGRRIAVLAQTIELGSELGRKRAIAEFAAMQKPEMIKPLARFADHRHIDVRRGVIAALSNIRTVPAGDQLAGIAIAEADIELRGSALEGMKRIKDYDPVSPFVSALRYYRRNPVNSKKDVIAKRTALSRGAWALGEIGELRAVPTLITVLVVDMGYTVVKQAPQRNISGPRTVTAPEIGPDGKPTGRVKSGRFTQGSYGTAPPEIEDVVFANDEALKALRKLTKQSFGLNKTTWGEWWLMNQPIFGAENPFDE